MNGRLKPNWYNARKVLNLFFGKSPWNHRCWRQRPIADDWLSQIMEKSKKITVNYGGIFFIICWPKFFFSKKLEYLNFSKPTVHMLHSGRSLMKNSLGSPLLPPQPHHTATVNCMWPLKAWSWLLFTVISSTQWVGFAVSIPICQQRYHQETP